MARRVMSLLVANALVAVLLHPVAAAAGQKKPATAARQEDVPYIQCQVCERIAREQVAKKQQALPPSKKVPEIQIINITENVCNLKKHEADWMLRIDIVQKGDKLELVEQDEEGHCNAECKTIERACQEVIGYADTDEQLASFLLGREITPPVVGIPPVTMARWQPPPQPSEVSGSIVVPQRSAEG